MLRIPFIVFLGAIVLWTLQSQLNHYIATWQLTVFTGGLLVAFTALRLSYREGVRALLLAGFWLDASTPVPFGLHAFLMVLTQTVIFGFRGRLAREETLVGVVCAAISNLVIVVALSAALLHRNPAPVSMASRLIADSLLSFCLILLVGPWFFALLEHLLEICGVNLRREQRGVA